MKDVTSAQNYLIYQPRSVDAPAAQVATAPTALTPGRWQTQMESLVQLFEGQPGAVPSNAPTLTAASPATVEAAPAVAPLTKTKEVPPVPGRDGQVLKEDTFLKADQYPGLHKGRLQSGPHGQPKLEGAPNYRQVGEGIYGVGQPTVDGIKAVLKQAGSGPGQGGKQAVWTNLRQEPVVFVNGEPFNLRNVKVPFSNQEAQGRTPEEADKIEQQLKNDVMEEARKNGGYIMMHDEAKEPPPRVIERRIKVESVQTIQEVYDGLQKDGYNVKFQRIPVTDCKKPEDKDIDALVKSLKGTDPDAPLIFNCHAGEGRTTTGMVLASILRRGEAGDTSSILKDKAFRADIKEQGNHHPANYRGVLQSIKDTRQLLGTQEEADAIIAQYGDVHNLKDAVAKANMAANDASKTPEDRQIEQQRSQDYLERYHVVLSFDKYCQEQAPDFKVDYSQWKRQHPEIEDNLHKLQAAPSGGPAHA